MPVLWIISIRNLLRQKRRNILLGIAIAFGTMILVLANAFSHGISDILFNKIMKYTAGHVSVSFTFGGNMFRQIFRDGDRMMALIKAQLGPADKPEEAVGMFCRAIGNNKSDNIMLIGIDMGQTLTAEELKETEDNFKMVEGRFEDVSDTAMENPALIAFEKARYMGVKKGDILRVRYPDIYGQDQVGRITVAGIFKPANPFMQMPVFLELTRLKALLGYGPHDIGQIYITIQNPVKNAILTAKKIYSVLQPSTAYLYGTMYRDEKITATGIVLGYKTDSLSLCIVRDSLPLTTGKNDESFYRKGVFASQELCTALGISAGDTCRLSYKPKYHGRDTVVPFVVTGIIDKNKILDRHVLLVNDKRFYDIFYTAWPENGSAQPDLLKPDSGTFLSSVAVPEWHLMKRSTSTVEVMKQYKELAKSRIRAVAVDVGTMYETGSAIIKLEQALNLITLVAVMVLFFIILIGVINTLRMTIRERTREIGTVRAIGMQKKDVRNAFVLETFLLTLFATLAGTAAAFLAMLGLSSLTIDPGENPMGMLLVDKHLHFSPTILGTVSYIILILLIAVVTAYFPARHAANLSAAAAFRHYE